MHDPTLAFLKSFQAIAHPTRWAILLLLADADEPLTQSLVVDTLGMAQGVVAHHLNQLYSSGVIDRRSAGSYVLYQLNKHTLTEMEQKLQEVTRAIKR